MENKWLKNLTRFLSYVLVSVLTASLTLVFLAPKGSFQKLMELESLIANRYIGGAEESQLLDGAAYGMVSAIGDRWSYYIPATQFDAHMEQMNNVYVGIGVTISAMVGEQGIEILSVEPTGGAEDAGILPGDILTTVNGQKIVENGIDKSKELIRGEEGTAVEIGVLRDGKPMTFSVTRKKIQVVVAKGQMLDNQIGLIKIKNFDARCAEETIKAIKDLQNQGAKKLIFDVRNNPGGYKQELVKVLDYLLPEGEIFRSVDYRGKEEVSQSDAACVDMPMAVLLNRESYSAAEFFGAALEEYDRATLVGEQTVGKGYFQETYRLKDGSAVGLSVGKYFTPKGVSLAEVGGLTPDVPVAVDAETFGEIYADVLTPEEDPQVKAAIEALSK